MNLVTSLITTLSTALVQFFFAGSSTTPPTNAPTLESPHTISITYQDNDYQIIWFSVDNLDHLSLQSNLASSQTSTQLADVHQCQYLINAGFYTPDQEHIGLMHYDQTTHSSAEVNRLFNGFLSLDDDNTAHITSTTPDLSSTKLALQTGPLLILNSDARELVLSQDKSARRSFAALDSEDNLLFGLVMSQDTQLTGPLLVNLPAILMLFSESINRQLVSAINLDGGAASAIITPDRQVSEFDPIGSFFCISNQFESTP